MSKNMFFVQECPTCGRRLQVRVDYLGKTIACEHCRAVFAACDPASQARPPAASSSADLLARVNELIAVDFGSRTMSASLS